jgi:hypothetical protein
MKYFGRVSKLLGGTITILLGASTCALPPCTSPIAFRPNEYPVALMLDLPHPERAQRERVASPCADQNRRDAMGSGWYRANNQSLSERPMIVAALRVDGETSSLSPTWPDKV